MSRFRWRDLPPNSLALAAAALTASSPPVASLLEYDRRAILQGEVWRIVTAHLTHCSAHHFLWNVLPLIGLGILFEKSLGRLFWPVLLASSFAVGGGLLLFMADLTCYRGLSGVLNGLWIAGALHAAGREKRTGHATMALLFRGCVLLDLAKIAFEAYTSTPIFTDPTEIGGEPIPLAHLLGAAAGFCAWLPAHWMSLRASSPASSTWHPIPFPHLAIDLRPAADRLTPARNPRRLGSDRRPSGHNCGGTCRWPRRRPYRAMRG